MQAQDQAMKAQDQPPSKRRRGRPTRDEAVLRNVLLSRGLLPSAESLSDHPGLVTAAAAAAKTPEQPPNQANQVKGVPRWPTRRESLCDVILQICSEVWMLKQRPAEQGV